MSTWWQDHKDDVAYWHNMKCIGFGLIPMYLVIAFMIYCYMIDKEY